MAVYRWARLFHGCLGEGASSVWRGGGGWVGDGEAGGARLDHEGPLVQLVIRQQPARVQQVVRRLLDRVDLVRGLLELPHLADNVGNLGITKNNQALVLVVFISPFSSWQS